MTLFPFEACISAAELCVHARVQRHQRVERAVPIVSYVYGARSAAASAFSRLRGSRYDDVPPSWRWARWKIFQAGARKPYAASAEPVQRIGHDLSVNIPPLRIISSAFCL